MLKPTVLLATTLLCAPAFAQETETIPVRAALSRIFLDMKAPFVIGPGIDGDITLSREILNKETPFRIKTILSTLPYNVEYSTENGIHFIRRKSDAPVVSIPATPLGSNISPNLSIAPPKFTLNPTTLLSYKDALQWELTRTEIERERLLSKSSEISRDEVAANQRTLMVLKQRLAGLESDRSPARTTRLAAPVSQKPLAMSYADTVRLELFYAELEMEKLKAQFSSNHPEVLSRHSVLEFLKRRVAELDGKATPPARKTAKR